MSIDSLNKAIASKHVHLSQMSDLSIMPKTEPFDTFSAKKDERARMASRYDVGAVRARPMPHFKIDASQIISDSIKDEARARRERAQEVARMRTAFIRHVPWHERLAACAQNRQAHARHKSMARGTALSLEQCEQFARWMRDTWRIDPDLRGELNTLRKFTIAVNRSQKQAEPHWKQTLRHIQSMRATP